MELDPNYIRCLYKHVVALVIRRRSSLIEEMNGLGTSKADDKRYDELRAERQNTL